MTRVNINGANHQVEVNHDGADLAYVIEKAQKLWNETAPTDQGPSAAYDYQSPAQSTHRGRAVFPYGEQPEVTA